MKRWTYNLLLAAVYFDSLRAAYSAGYVAGQMDMLRAVTRGYARGMKAVTGH